MCFKNHYGVNFLQMGWQIIKSLDSSIKLSLTDDFPCRNKDLHTVDARQNFTEIFPDNSNCFSFPCRVRVTGFYCTYIQSKIYAKKH